MSIPGFLHKILLASLLFGFSTHAMEFRRGEKIEVRGEYTDSIFAMGSEIRGELTSTDSLFMAGSKVHLINSRAETSILAGADVLLDHGEFKDAIIAGRSVRVDATTISDDLIAAGAHVEIGAAAVINGSTLLAGRDVVFGGAAVGDVQINGRNVTVTGTIDRNLSVQADRLIIADGARVTGDLRHTARVLEISPGATIGGRNEAVSPTPISSSSNMAAVLAAILFMAGAIFAPAIVAAIFPGFVQRATALFRTRFWDSLGVGILCAIAFPFLLVILLFSVIGLPFGIFAIPFLLVAGLMGWTVALFAVGSRLRGWFYRGSAIDIQLPRGRVFGWSVLGAVALMIVMMVPVLGFFACVILFFAGLGAVLMNVRGSLPRTQTVSEPSGRYVPV